MKRKHLCSKIACLLAFLMLFCALPFSVFADDVEPIEPVYTEENPAFEDMEPETPEDPDPDNPEYPVLPEDPDDPPYNPAYSTISEGVYMIKHSVADYSINLPGCNITENTQMIQWVIEPNRNSRFKICSLGNGLYCLRSMEKNDMGLMAHNGKLVNATIGKTNSASVVPMKAQWLFYSNSYGYYIQNMATGQVITSPSSTGYGEAYLLTLSDYSGSALQSWTLTSVSETPSTGVDLRNVTGSIFAGDSFQFTASTYSYVVGWNGQQGITWSVTNGAGTATIDTNTGVLVGHTTGTVTVTADYIGYSSSCTVNIFEPFESGAYYIKTKANSTHNIQIDNDDSSNNYLTDDAILEVWEFTGEAHQCWNVIHVQDGYYKLISVRSGKAITVQSSYVNSDNKTLVQQAFEENNNRQLWKITLSSYGGYIIRPKSGEDYSTDWCMATRNSWPMPWDGRNVIQGDYVDNTSYYDEWLFERAIYGTKGYRNVTSTGINCHGYATMRGDAPAGWLTTTQPYLNSNFDFSDTPTVGSISSAQIAQVRGNVKNDFETWLSANYYNAVEETDFDNNGANRILGTNQYRVALKVGLHYVEIATGLYRLCFDYHFWYQTASGQWANKHGATPSELLPEGITPLSTSTSGWNLDYLYNGTTTQTYTYFYDGPVYIYIISE